MTLMAGFVGLEGDDYQEEYVKLSSAKACLVLSILLLFLPKYKAIKRIMD